MLTAPEMDYLLRVFSNKSYNPESYDIQVKDKINKLYALLDKIKPLSDDEYKILYFSVEKGTIEKYGDYEELKAYDEVKNYQEFIDRFNEEYPDEVNWYKMVSTKYKNYRATSINSENIIYADMESENDNFENYQLQELLNFLIIKVKECIKSLEDGTYNDYISKNYSYKNRFGVIKRNEYWKLYPETKQQLLKEISLNEINYFIENAKNEIDNRIKNMTSGKYFECV